MLSPTSAISMPWYPRRNSIVLTIKIYLQMIIIMVRVPDAGQIEYMEVHKGDDLRRAVITADSLCVVAAYTGVAMRMISRRLVRAGYKADDWLILAGLVSIECQRTRRFG